MQEQEIELAVGDVIRIGNHTVTVIDIDGTEVGFRVDSYDFDGFTIEDNQPAVHQSK